jgi:hypothetical protein
LQRGGSIAAKLGHAEKRAGQRHGGGQMAIASLRQALSEFA